MTFTFAANAPIGKYELRKCDACEWRSCSSSAPPTVRRCVRLVRHHPAREQAGAERVLDVQPVEQRRRGTERAPHVRVLCLAFAGMARRRTCRSPRKRTRSSCKPGACAARAALAGREWVAVSGYVFTHEYPKAWAFDQASERGPRRSG